MSEWISVEDRLPDEDGWYLCTVDTDDGRIVRTLPFHDGDWWDAMDIEQTFCQCCYYSPIYWKQLEPPY